jgi:dipeptidase E
MVYFSGDPCAKDCQVTAELKELLPAKLGECFFIPADNHDVEGDYLQAQSWLTELGFRRVELVLSDRPVSQRGLRGIAKAAMVFMGGGNTFFLMKHLNSSGLSSVLPEVHHRGGVLGGQSAGAIVMTPTIHTAGFPHFDRDDNIVGLKKMSGMNLVNFEFFPHFVNRPRYSRSLRRYSRVRQVLVYGCDDNAGIVVHDNRAIFVGNVWGFWGGLRVKLNPASKER